MIIPQFTRICSILVICVIFNPQNSLVIQLSSLTFYRWKNRFRFVSQNKTFSIWNPVLSAVYHADSEIVNHKDMVATEMKIIMHRKDNENVRFSKILKFLSFAGDVFNTGDKNTPNNLPPIISIFQTKYVNYLYESYAR